MNTTRNLLGLCIAIAVGFAGAFLLAGSSASGCSPMEELLTHPIDSLLAVPQPVSTDANPYDAIYDGRMCDPPASALEMWLLVWLPLCAVAVATGFLAARLATSPSWVRSSIAGVFAVTPNILLFGSSGPLIAPTAMAVVLTATMIAALLGMTGERIYRQYHPDKQDDGLLQHPERLDQMLDETDDA